ncbi:hypothetical protein VKT23_008107 [Stygiomarasmius scandens]|uniref:Uncharacterized protein n=1 Tax=Marasmiellus scandens TaxID=2682957 RepID=A0ABR1JJU0_9AGAR
MRATLFATALLVFFANTFATANPLLVVRQDGVEDRPCGPGSYNVSPVEGFFGCCAAPGEPGTCLKPDHVCAWV